MQSESDQEIFERLFKRSKIPLYTCLPALTWVLYDYLLTLSEEAKYIWPQKRNFGTLTFFWIRYYTILLVVFDVAQIHSFAIPGVPTVDVCVAMDPTIRVVGALSLWAVEIVMQTRIYCLYGGSKKIAFYNGALFLASIVAWVYIMYNTAQHRKVTISSATKYHLPGCPTINGGIRWAVWVPATIFEANLFFLALYRAFLSISARTKINKRNSLIRVLLQHHLAYFLGITGVLIMSNVMAVGTPFIPWFGYAPFHAAVGIMTSRMHIHLIKFSEESIDNAYDTTWTTTLDTSEPLSFA
ncbi:hypothetical protein CPB83DRAFT_780309 [Crepidotus variabilis]|uniref:DUF6533 domain-containing protein n=1 Tax=Crepidotus variabilis TaxID=179855 RepID=A0A9P6ETP8_9AGAR|nr:hypothetical protein CPB83DRAFT_780309 [Crepidotus variabilis]